MARNFNKTGTIGATLAVGAGGNLFGGSSRVAFHCWARADTVDVGSSDNRLFSFMIGSNVGMFVAAIQSTGTLMVGGRSGSGDTFQSVASTRAITLDTKSYSSFGGMLDFENDRIVVAVNGVIESGTVTFGNTTLVDSGTGRTAKDFIGGLGNSSGNNSASSTASMLHGAIHQLYFWSNLFDESSFIELAKGAHPRQIAHVPTRGYEMDGSGTRMEPEVMRGLPTGDTSVGAIFINGRYDWARPPEVTRWLRRSPTTRAAIVYPFPGSTAGNYTITGAVSYPLSVAATDMLQGEVLDGAVTYPLTVAASAMLQGEVLDGAVTYPLSVAASAMTYTPASGAYTIDGAVSYPVSVAASEMLQGEVISGAVTHPLAVAASSMVYAAAGAYTLSGAVALDLGVGASMSYTSASTPVEAPPILDFGPGVHHVEQYVTRKKKRKVEKRSDVVTVILPLEAVMESDSQDAEDIVALLDFLGGRNAAA